MVKDSNKKDTSIYLQKLRFCDGDYPRILKNYVTNMRLVSLVLVFLILGGLVSFFSVSRTLNPQINIAIVIVTTILPGATPTDVESLVTKKLEQEIKKIDDVDVITSTSRESTSVIVVQFKDKVESDSAQTDVQNAVGFVSNMPDATESSRVRAIDFEDTPILRYAVTSDSLDKTSLDSFTDALVEDIEDQDLIDRVEVSGNETQEVQILISQERLQELGINLQTLTVLISNATSSFPSGVVQSDMLEIGLTIDRDSMTVDELRNVVIAVGGVLYRIGDIAEVAERSMPGHMPAFITSPNGVEYDAVTIDVYRVLGSKITNATKQTEFVVNQHKGVVDNTIIFEKITDINADINKSFNNLFRNLSLTVVLVFLVLLLFVGVRQAILAALSVPLVFMVAFIAMYLMGISLNFLSIFSLLLALGLLVDVTIVIISAITTYYRSGRFTPQEAALLVWKDFFATLLVTTLTTVWAFLPLLLASGIMGEFLKSLPIVVSAVLLGSVFVGFFVILPLMVWFLDFILPRRVRIALSIIVFGLGVFALQKMFVMVEIVVPSMMWLVILPLIIIAIFAFGVIWVRGWRFVQSFVKIRFCVVSDKVTECFQDGIINISFIKNRYNRILDRALRTKKTRWSIIGMVVVFFVFSVMLVATGFVENEFFPGDDMNVVYIGLELPLDTRSIVSEESAHNIVSQFVGISGIANIQTQIGASIGADGMVSIGQEPNNVLITMNLIDEDDRDITSVEIATLLRDSDPVKNYVDGKVTVIELGSGPPAGADVTIKLAGDDLAQLNIYADQIADKLEKMLGVINVGKSVESGSSKVTFVPNKDKMMEYGLTTQDVGFYLRVFGNGVVISDDIEFSDLTNNRDIVLRLTDDVQMIDAFERAVMTTNSGVRVPLTTLGKFEFKENPVEIGREDLKRTLTVTANVEEGYNANKINQNIASFIDEDVQLQKGYSWKTGGANEENQESVQSVLKAMVLAAVLIFITLIIQLNSYRKSFIVLLVIPLAISGVFVVFAFVGLSLSFPALIGLLALFGIVINNSIMIIDQINKNHKEGITFHKSVVEGSTSRFEPILLSSLTTVVGLLPITLSEPVWQGLGGTIIAGLLFSGTIMLFFIPTVYYLMFEKEYI